jgi:hypothetical protein
MGIIMSFEVGDLAGYWKAFSHNLNEPQPLFLGTLDGLLTECFEKLDPDGRVNEVKMFSASFAGIRAASMMALGGSAMHIPAVLRTSLESAAYGALFGNSQEWYQIWSQRHDDKTAKDKFRKSGLAMAKQSVEKLGGGFKSNFESLYQMLIDFGAHPNVLGIDSFVDVQKIDQDTDYYQFQHLSANSERQEAFFIIGQVGLFLTNVLVNSWKAQLKTQTTVEQIRKLLSQLDNFERRLVTK